MPPGGGGGEERGAGSAGFHRLEGKKTATSGQGISPRARCRTFHELTNVGFTGTTGMLASMSSRPDTGPRGSGKESTVAVGGGSASPRVL
jgi:hypothetical protein